MTNSSQDEPHIVIKSAPVTINLRETTYRRSPYLPDCQHPDLIKPC
jgi:hypothetical protein